MDSLTPDKDDLERFRQDRTKAASAKPAAGDRGVGKSNPVAPPAARKTAAQPSAGSAAWLTAFALLLIVAVAVVSFWQIFRQQATIDQLQAELGEASQYINQSKLVTARLEGSLSETEANVAQSGSQLASRLNTIDSEIRKLWDVTNKRNIQLIKEAQSKIAALEATNSKLQTRLEATEQEIAKASRLVGEQQARVDGLVQTQDSLKAGLTKAERVAEAAAKADAVARVESMAKNNQAQLAAVTKRIEAVASQGAGQEVDGRVKNLETAIDSIDVNRQQLNRRVLDLERRLNEAQLRLNALSGAGAGG